jgi:FtsZ-binding cell division protein ZapB
MFKLTPLQKFIGGAIAVLAAIALLTLAYWSTAGTVLTALRSKGPFGVFLAGLLTSPTIHFALLLVALVLLGLAYAEFKANSVANKILSSQGGAQASGKDEKALQFKIDELEGQIKELNAEVEKHRKTEDNLIKERDSFKAERDSLQADLEAGMWKNQRIHYQAARLRAFVLVNSCDINASYLSEGELFFDLKFTILNLSIFTVSIKMSPFAVVEGSTFFKGKPLSGEAKLIANHVERIRPTDFGEFVIRQWVNEKDAKDIPSTLKEIGNLFDFSRLNVYVSIEELPDRQAIKLDLTRAMQNTELENENVVMRNENNRLKKGLTLWHDSTSRIEELIRTLGMFYLAYNQLEQNEILSKDTANNLKGRFMQALFHCFGDHKREDEYSDNLPPFPDSINEQKVWINSQCEMLRNIIDEQREGLSDYVQNEGSTPNS